MHSDFFFLSYCKSSALWQPAVWPQMQPPPQPPPVPHSKRSEPYLPPSPKWPGLSESLGGVGEHGEHFRWGCDRQEGRSHQASRSWHWAGRTRAVSARAGGAPGGAQRELTEPGPRVHAAGRQWDRVTHDLILLFSRPEADSPRMHRQGKVRHGSWLSPRLPRACAHLRLGAHWSCFPTRKL